GLAEAHDVPAHPSHRPCGRDGLGNEPSTLRQSLRFLEAGPGTGLLCCPGQIGEAHANRGDPTNIGAAFDVRSRRRGRISAAILSHRLLALDHRLLAFGKRLRGDIILSTFKRLARGEQESWPLRSTPSTKTAC